MKNPIIVALDVDEPQRAWKLVEQLQPYVGGFKIGPRLTLRSDKKFLKDISQQGILFFDHKFFDIPTTMVSSIEAAAELGAHWITIHALSGDTAMRAIAGSESKICESTPQFRILAVTVLTSFSESDLPSIWKKQPIGESVEELADSVQASGLSSLVCSPHEIRTVKKKWPESFLVVPGIRASSTAKDADDQKRSATAGFAMKEGASALVVGRPIIQSSNPIAETKSILESLQELQ